MTIRWELAACIGYDPELWFSSNKTEWDRIRRRKARDICRSCDVQPECLAMTLTPGGVKAHYRYGIFGGLSARQRLGLSKRKPRHRARAA